MAVVVTRRPPVINPQDAPYNARGDATDDTAELQAALTAGAGRSVFIPATSSYYKISAPLAVSANTTITLESGTIIEQTVHYKPVFDINLVNDVTIDGNGALLRFTGTRTWAAGTTTRGDGEAVYGAGVWTSGDRTKIRHLKVSGFVVGVHCSGWNGSALTAYDKTGNVVEDIEVDTVDFGLLWTGQDNFTFSNIRGTSVIESGSPNPSHVLYGSFGARSRNIKGADCEAHDIADSYAFQFKGQDGGTVKNLTARNTIGLLSIGGGSGAHNTDLSISNVNGTSIGSTGTGAVYFQGSDVRVRIDGLNLHRSAADISIRFDGTDCTITNAKIRTRQDSQSDLYDVTIIGTRNVIDGISLVNIQDNGTDYATARRGIAVDTGTDCAVRPHTIRNTRIGIVVTATATNPRIDLSQSDIVLAATDGLLKVSNASTSAVFVSPGGKVSADVGNAAKTLIHLNHEPTHVWNTALTADRAVVLSTSNVYNGATFRVIRTANATGAFNLNVGTGPLKALTAGQFCDVTYNGSAWTLTGFGSL